LRVLDRGGGSSDTVSVGSAKCGSVAVDDGKRRQGGVSTDSACDTDGPCRASIQCKSLRRAGLSFDIPCNADICTRGTGIDADPGGEDCISIQGYRIIRGSDAATERKTTICRNGDNAVCEDICSCGNLYGRGTSDGE